ncbi:G protein-coupled receptor, rhodopsin-like family and GPCR, rhodopsin-like, 7TM domain and 7TM GPCR, serpentine receptor class w (Srw) family-containing protein [Strongyloides ratti]|uniref:G protein-coupled receptor, rhodopsin-like family and GPCR, rhodopsin-like, 7TM domain and 7TM GPCR, serpentine receptor class w (Srw) family-containing protein n=1 Tax=Strongyloides ratti TaxID=34506 RepID=A0A090L4T7_STRRB|nr:G protein-coupled receptor, rhodopsin-like family and GPCR, rhodopsin-like, 7TM domain and 7TM GPCR, serpentine receptor class w (Srw) family-containing protein [Strongyloides ratti]CEF62519.1 G protein-coupled receptor, rhodopsin-like family and GPCR, rhodopsin-like, 7TM domain and 7TM GPCR, serpentine receptor class w (Srw) family-containing protein [Strongyloides ratti]
MSFDTCTSSSNVVFVENNFIQVWKYYLYLYSEYHSNVALGICIIGILLNIVTVAVLSRPIMRNSINIILCFIAICDIIVMLSYAIFNFHYYVTAGMRCSISDWSYGWALFMMFHANSSVIVHSTSLWLTVSLAQIRLLTIRKATVGPTGMFSERATVYLSIATFFTMFIVNIPNILSMEIFSTDSIQFFKPFGCLTITNYDDKVIYNFPSSENETIENIDKIESNIKYLAYSYVRKNNCIMIKISYWINGAIYKIVPCVLLTISIVALLKMIKDVKKRRLKLAECTKRKIPKDHTTPMLACVLIIFLITELPQGILHLLSGIYTHESFQDHIIKPFGDFSDLLSLTNSATSFIIYCTMSRKFRAVFFAFFCDWLPKPIKKHIRETDRFETKTDATKIKSSRGNIIESSMYDYTQHRLSIASSFAGELFNTIRDDRKMSWLSRKISNIKVKKNDANNLESTIEHKKSNFLTVPSSYLPRRISLTIEVDNKSEANISLPSFIPEDEDSKITIQLPQTIMKPSISSFAKSSRYKKRFGVFKKMVTKNGSSDNYRVTSPERRLNNLTKEIGYLG